MYPVPEVALIEDGHSVVIRMSRVDAAMLAVLLNLTATSAPTTLLRDELDRRLIVSAHPAVGREEMREIEDARIARKRELGELLRYGLEVDDE